MTLARYQDLALEAIGEVLTRSKLPILVGGTPLYINAVIEGWNMPRVPPNPALRAALEAEAGTQWSGDPRQAAPGGRSHGGETMR